MGIALKRSEQNLQSEARLRRKKDVMLQEAINGREKLEKDNLDLSLKMQNILKELEESRNEVANLLQSAHQQQQDDWEVREAKLNNIIRGLKRQLRDESSLARMYRAEMFKRKELGKEVVRLKRESRNAKANATSRTEGGSQTPFSSGVDLTDDNLQPVAIKASIPEIEREIDIENQKNGTPQQTQKVRFACEQPSVEKSRQRVERRRATGGRKALQENLRKIRSPLAAVHSMNEA